MNSMVIQILTIVISIATGGGLVSLLTVRAQRDRIVGESDVSKANAAKTYHEISMEMIEEARQQVAEMRSEMKSMKDELQETNLEVKALRGRVKELTEALDEKDRIIRLQEKELQALRGGSK